MLYLIGQIVLCLLFTALVGVAVGWLLRGLGAARQTDTVEARWRTRFAHLEQQHARQAAELAAAPATEQAPSTPPTPPTDDQAGPLRERLAERERELAALRTAQAIRQQPKPVEELVTRMRESQQLCQQLQGNLSDQRAANDHLVKQLELAQSERDTLIMRLRDNEAEIGKINNERQHALATTANLQKELRALRGALARTATQPPTPPTPIAPPNTPTGETLPAATEQMKPGPVHAPGPRSATPEASGERPESMPPGRAAHSGAASPPTPPPRTTPHPSAAPSQPTSASAQRPGAPAPATTQERQRALPIAASPVPTEAYQPRWRLTEPRGKRDNLQAIYGIGPKIEARLNQLGVYHFSQIASFRREDILWVAERLEAFPGRILRDRWVEQARALHRRASNGPG